MAKAPFILAGIHTLEFATLPENCNYSEEANINVDFDFKLNDEHYEKGAFIVVSMISFIHNDKPFILSKVATLFKFDIDSWNEYKSEKKIQIPKHIVDHMCAINLGTARGIIHARVTGSKVSTYYLPTMDISNLIGGDLVMLNQMNQDEQE